MSKLSHKVRHDLRLSVSDRMELADALDAMEAALLKIRNSYCRQFGRDPSQLVGVDPESEMGAVVTALAKLEAK